MNTGSGINSFENIRTMIKTSSGITSFNLSFPYSNYLHICCHALDSDSTITSSPVDMLLDLNRATYYDTNFFNTGNMYTTGVSLSNISNTTLQITLGYKNSSGESFHWNVKGMIIYQCFTFWQNFKFSIFATYF